MIELPCVDSCTVAVVGLGYVGLPLAVEIANAKVNILTVAKMKRGFKSSIGCNLKKYKFNHLLAPLTSNPIMGTKINNRKDIMKSGITIFFNNDVSIAEIANIIKKASIVKIKCFEKKK